MAQSRNKLFTTRRTSGSFLIPNPTGIGVSVGIASTAILSNTSDYFFRGIHHLKSPVEAVVHLQSQSGQGGGTPCGRGGGGGGGGYSRSKIDNVVGKRFIATVSYPSPAPTGFWTSDTEYIAVPKGSNGSSGGGDTDPGRGISCPGGAGGGGGGSAVRHPTTSLFSVLQNSGGSTGSGGPGLHGDPDHQSHGAPGPGGNSGFRNYQPGHPFAPLYGNGGAGSSNPGQDGFIITETPGRPWNMRGGGYPTSGYTLS